MLEAGEVVRGSAAPKPKDKEEGEWVDVGVGGGWTCDMVGQG
jgi:hypothetical protein